MKKFIFNGMPYKKGKELYGIHRYQRELLYEMDCLSTDCDLTVVCPKDSDAFDGLRNIEVSKLHIRGGEIGNLMWNAIGFPAYCKIRHAASVDLVLTYPLFGSNVVAIYDCVFERSFGKGLKKYFYRGGFLSRIKINVKRSKKIITISEFSKQDIKHFYNVPDEKIEIISCAWQHFDRIEKDETVIEELNLANKDYFYALGSRSARKNDKWILAAARNNPQYLFVVSGSTSFSNGLENESIPSNMLFTGYLEDSKVKALMSHCKAFIQPSLIEGFGIPPMEAMSTGAKVIVSNTTSLPEIYEKSAWYIDPYNYDGIDLSNVMKNKIEENDAVLSRFSWKKSARELLTVLEQL